MDIKKYLKPLKIDIKIYIPGSSKKNAISFLNGVNSRNWHPLEGAGILYYKCDIVYYSNTHGGFMFLACCLDMSG